MLILLSLLMDVVLAVAPGDEDALRCKVVALVKAGDFDRALRVILASQKSLVDFVFLKVWCCSIKLHGLFKLCRSVLEVRCLDILHSRCYIYRGRLLCLRFSLYWPIVFHGVLWFY